MSDPNADAPHHAGREERIEAIFDEAMRAPADGRGALLDRLCGSDGDLRAEVESLLAHAQQTRDFLESPLLPGSVPMPLPEQIGPFKVVGMLGEGGMGCVYEARQERPNRSVAIKVVRPDAMSPGSLRRFDREIETLGQLRHPWIAQLYEVGQHVEPGGRAMPYLVMELVRGVALTKFAAAQKLSVAERCALLAEIADAVQYAHQRGVIHRDLKPENILVERGPDGAPAPKILDFGIARLTDGSAEQQHTLAGQPMGTLAYMSPEQFAADPRAIDTRSDVYALGVIAYEVFAGSRPFDVTGLSVVQAARMIESVEPPALGTIDRSLRGDIETIVSRAMAKDRERRYASAAALADDLRRHLRDETILARPPTTAYQISKFALRNKGLVGGACAALLAIIAGMVVSTVMYVRQQRAAKRAADEAALSLAVRDYMIDGLLMAASPTRMGYDVKMMDVLTQASDGLHERFKDQPAVEAQVRHTLGSVLAQLGRYKECVEQLRLCLPLMEKTSGPLDEETIAALCMMSHALGRLQRSNEQLDVATDALARARRGLAPDNPRAITARNDMGAALQALGRIDEAVPILNEGLRLAEASPQENEESIGSILSQLAACEQALGHKEAVLALARRQVEHFKKTNAPDSELCIVARNNLVNSLYENGKFEEAADIAAALPASAERTYPPGHANRGYAYMTACNALQRVGRFEDAERYGLKAYENLSTAVGDPSWPAERAADVVRRVYARWPGHSDQLLEWCVRGMRARMMVAHVDELPTTLKTLEQLSKLCAGAKINLGDQGLMGPVWQRRDELAPPGHPRRAMFMANYALMCDAVEGCTLTGQAADLAAAALPDVKDEPNVAVELVAAARKAAGK